MPSISALPLLVRKILVGMHGSLCFHFPAARRKDTGSKIIVACVFSIGERTEDQVLAGINRQTLPVSRIELIRNVCPISTASNRALDLAHDADFLLWVDADMILYPHCNEHLVRLMRPDTLYAVATLADPVFGNVGYIKLLNMHIVRSLGLRFRNVLGCDVDFCMQAKEKGADITIETYTLSRTPLGVHHPTYTARELFKKNQIEKKKRGNRIDGKLLSGLTRKYLLSSNPVILAGILGEILPNPDPAEGESVPESGLHHWETVRVLLGNVPDDLTYGFPDE